MTGTVKFVLGSSLVVSTYFVSLMRPFTQRESTTITHLVSRASYREDTNAIMAEHGVEIANTSTMAQLNSSDIRVLNSSLAELDKRELEHYNSLARQQEVDETKVIQTLKVIGWLVSLVEGAHVTLTVRSLFSKRRHAKAAKRRPSVGSVE